MANRTKLHINPSGYDGGVTWHVYRSTSPEGIMVQDNLIMKVNEKEADKNIFKMTGDVLNGSSDDPFLFFCSHRYQIQPQAPVLYINGEIVDAANIEWFPGEQFVRVIDSRLSVGNTHMLTMDYYYISILFYDDSRPQNGVEYLGTPPHGLKTVHGYKIDTIDTQNQSTSFSWLHDKTGYDYYYQVVARTPKYKSQDSSTIGIYLEQKSDSISYRIERATSPNTPDTEWEYVTTIQTMSYTDSSFLHDLPLWLLKEEVQFIKQDDSSVLIRVPNPYFDEDVRSTYTYRICPEDNCGFKGEWQYIYPETIVGDITLAKIRRHRYTGTPSSFSSIDDGIDIVVWDDTTQGTTEFLEYVDTYIDPYQEDTPREYGYTFYVRDVWNKISEPVYIAFNLDTGEVFN